MTDVWVSPSGSDANPGTQLSPVLTLAKGVSLVQSGGRLIAEAGEWHEQVAPIGTKDNVQFLGAKDLNGLPLSKINADGTRARCIVLSGGGLTNWTIDGWECFGATTDGIKLDSGTKGATGGSKVQNCDIHHVYGPASATGVQLANGADLQVLNCRIHHIGLYNESWGVFVNTALRPIVDGCVIYMVRKEGIRGYLDKDSIRRNNRIFLCWIGISDAVSLSPLIYNNLAYNCTYGCNPKHSNSGGLDPVDAYETWGLDPNDTTVPWSRWYHNTFWNCTDGLLYFANAQAHSDGTPFRVARQIDFRNNIIGGRAGSYVFDPAYTGRDAGSVVIDHNLLATTAPTPTYVYRTGYSFFTASNTLDLAGMQSTWGWGTNTLQVDPQFNDSGPVADFNYPNTSPANNAGVAAGVNGALPLGTQMGARTGVAVAPKKWTERPLTGAQAIVNSSSMGRVFDAKQATYWTGTQTNSWVVGDAGSSVTANAMIEDCWIASGDPKNFQIDVADSLAGPWTTVLGPIKHFDQNGTSYKYEFGGDLSTTPRAPITATGRYWRYTAIDNFSGGSTSTIVAGFQIGMLEDVGAGAPPPPTPTLAVTPASLAFSGPQGGVDPLPQTLSIVNTTGGTMNWTVSDDAAWLSVTPASGTNNGTLIVSVATAGLTAGTYTGHVTVTATGATGSPVIATVTLTVNAAVAPVLAVSPSSLAFTGQQGDTNALVKTLVVSNGGGGTLNWTVSDNVSWLTVTPSSGTDTGAVSVSIDSTGLAVGSYAGVITINGGAGGIVTVSVALQVLQLLAAVPHGGRGRVIGKVLAP